MKRFAWGICYSTSKCRSADIVLETLETFSETCLVCVFQARVSWLVYCITLKIYSSLEQGRVHMDPWHGWSLDRFTTSSIGSNISTTWKSWWKMPHMSLCSLGCWEIFLVPSQTTSDSQLTSFPRKYRLFLLQEIIQTSSSGSAL